MNLWKKTVLRFLTIILGFSVFILVSAPAHGQLITDSKSKLKSQKAKKEKNGFLFFGKKKGERTTSGPEVQNAPAPKYSDASIGKRFRNLRAPTPRYSNAAASGRIAGRSGSPRYSGKISWKGVATGSGARYSRPVSWKGSIGGSVGRYSRPVSWKGTPSMKSPKYSRPVSWKGSVGGGAPRYSRPVSWKGTPSLGAPRYSKPVSWKGASFGGSPRYSRPVSWNGTPSLKSPKYSRPVSWKGAVGGGAPRYSRPVSWKGTPSLGAPRYSKPISWKGTPYGGSPRYSRPVSWKGTPSIGKPRYSQPVSWKGAPYGGSPRYSQPVSWKGAYFPGKPRYSSFKNRFEVSKKYIKQTRPYTPWIADYRGFVKYKKPSYRNMHPSVNYLTAKGIPIKLVRKGLRKWNVFWVRLNDSKITPRGSHKFVKKPKFDRKEKDIWNNGRDEKPTTRQDVAAQAEVELGETENEGENQ